MRTFDCLAPEAKILGPHFLEASAGTGKTFAVEHIVARLLLDEQVSIGLEQILVVTFTRAAARELKLRIRANLQKILDGSPWSYLQGASLSRIADALAIFDRCQIFTIHGFCHRMLREFAFEAKIAFLQEEQLRTHSPKRDAALKDFFECKLSAEIISPEQLEILLKEIGSVEDLANRLKKADAPQSAKTWGQRFHEFQTVLSQYPNIEERLLKADWESIREGYKKGKGDLDGQVDALAKAFSDRDNPYFFNSLIREKGSLFEFLDPGNKKMRAKETVSCFHYPGFFDWAKTHVSPLIKDAANPKEIFDAVLNAFKPIDRKVLEEGGHFSADELLLRMQKALQCEPFFKKVQQRYKAVLIDEFQDTDPIQWDIFERLFLTGKDAFYLIGDPKQSIYRFRKADLYTYLKAKESIDPDGHYYLDTNFRSSKQLISTLNHLFDREWLHLPKEKKTLPYLPVKAGLDLATGYPDEKGAVHCILFESEGREDVYRYIAREIQQLRHAVSSYDCWAILVKDRYEASNVQSVLTRVGIPSCLKSQDPLSQTLAFEAFVEFFEALRTPRSLGKAKAVFAGPFGGYSAQEILHVDSAPLSSLRAILDEKGLASMLQAFFQLRLNGVSVLDRIASQGRQFYSDCHQVVELLFEWEKSVGFSLEGLMRYFNYLRRMSPDETILQRKEEAADGVQIMTMHASKGLEFELVFALGLGARTPQGDEEGEAEKQRLLYVAMTRAKKRLYLPIFLESKEALPGTYAPIELFCKSLSTEREWEEELRRLASMSSLTLEKVKAPIVIEATNAEQEIQREEPPLPILPHQPSYLLSFTALAREAQSETLEPLPDGQFPRGAQTGILVHRIFERIFAEETAWKTASQIARIVEEELVRGPLSVWKENVFNTVQATLDFLLPTGFRLRDIDPQFVRVETEFLFETSLNYMKGFIDLIFMHEGKVYVLDWKTNWLPDYTPESLQKAVVHHQYDLQASIYAEALTRSWKGANELFGGAIYVFVRGPAAFCSQPQRRPLEFL